MASKSTEDQFQTDWSKAAAWAESNDIGAKSYLPVFQLDQQRVQNGGYAMSSAERNRAILAAANPNNVTPNPVDNPSPSSVFGNARNDLRSIATGLMPNKLVSGLFGLVKSTAEDLANPRKVMGPNVGTTVANVFQNTLASFIPGAYDIGTVLRADPTLSGDAGAKALLQHPLVAALDLVPAGKAATGAIAAGADKTVLRGALSDKLNMTSDALSESGPITLIKKALEAKSSNMYGITPDGAGLTSNLSWMDAVTRKLQDGPLGTSPAVRTLLGGLQKTEELASSVYQGQLAPELDAVNALTDPKDQAAFAAVWDAHRKGTNIETLLNDPKMDSAVKNAVIKTWRGSVSDAQEMHLMSGEVQAIQRPDGREAIYNTKGITPEVIAKRDALTKEAIPGFQKEFLKATELGDRLDKLNQADAKFLPALSQATQAARKAIEGPAADDLTQNITSTHQKPGAKKPEVLYHGTKKQAATKMFGQGGYVDNLVDAMQQGNTDQAYALARTISANMSQWGVKSVDSSLRPEFAKVRDLVSQIRDSGKARAAANREVDKAVQGERARVSRETSEQAARRRTQKAQQKARQAEERRTLADNNRRELLRVKTKADRDKAYAGTMFRRQIAQIREEGDRQAENASPEAVKAIVAKTRAREAKLRHDALHPTLKQYKREAEKAEAEVREKFRKDTERLKKAHAEDKISLQDMHDWEREQDGKLTQAIAKYSRAFNDFHRAVYNNPSDIYRDLHYDVYTKNLMDHEHSAELIDAASNRLMEKSGWTQSRVDALHENDTILREVLAETVTDVYHNPSNFDPELVDAAAQMQKDATRSANDEVNKLIAQGFKPIWLPAAGPHDILAASVKNMVGKGVPHTDAAFAKVRNQVNTRYDVVTGIAKDMRQKITKDAYIEFVEHYMAPISKTGDEVKDFIRSLDPSHPLALETLDTKEETLLSKDSRALVKMGLTKFDFEKELNVARPAWKGQDVYIPTGLAKSLIKLRELEEKGNSGILNKGRGLYMTSILGLSPRYTAHVLFGGSFLLAVRSTPRAPTLILQAAKALRDGSLPMEILGQNTEEGLARFHQDLRTGLEEHGRQSGKKMASLMGQEEFVKQTGLTLDKANPITWAKAVAQVNFRFTHRIRTMQSAVAYLDHATAAERRTTFKDELTGEVRPMTKERAMEEGIKHVYDVFGDLRSRTPLERAISRSIFPFFGWTQHILKYVLTMPFDHPYRAMVLGLIAYENSESVPKGLYERMQFLFNLGSPDSSGNVTALDLRFMDPLRDVASYASIGGWLQGLNPLLEAPLALFNPSIVYGSNDLYPNVTYDQFYGIETASDQGSPLSGLEQFVPQLGALGQAFTAATNARSLASTNPKQFAKSMAEDLNAPFLLPEQVNSKQIAAKDEEARYNVAKSAATNAWTTGDFSSLDGYASVPSPLNPDYEITPAELQGIYNQALQQFPTLPPSAVVAAPANPAGF